MFTQLNNFGKSCILKSTLGTKKICFAQARGFKLAVLGAMSSVGQPLTLLLKQLCEFDEIAVVDDSDTDGLALELNNTDTLGHVTDHVGSRGQGPAIKNADIVLLAGGVPFNGEATSMPSDVLESNCRSVFEYAKACVAHNPKAFICVITSPVNCTLPIVSQTFTTSYMNLRHQRIMGVNNLQAVRACNCVYDFFKVKPLNPFVPIVGGCSTKTVVPIFSYVSPSRVLPYEKLNAMMKAFRRATEGTHRVPDSTHDMCSLSHAYGAFMFVRSLVQAVRGFNNIMENAFVMNKNEPEAPYFSMPVKLGQNGIESKIGIPPSATSYEKTLVEKAKLLLKKDVCLGLEYHKKFMDETEHQANAKLT